MAYIQTKTLLMQIKLKLSNEDCNIKSLFSSFLTIVTSIEDRVTKIEKEMRINQKDIGNFQEAKNVTQNLKEKMKETESSINEMKTRNNDLELISKQMQHDIKNAEQEYLRCNEEIRNLVNKTDSQLQDQFENLHHYVTEIKCHSMKNNLIFSGLPYENNEDCEQTVKTFLYNEMGIRQNIEIENVHRFGNPGLTGVKPIVAHFIYRKELEIILNHGYRLKGKFYSVNEQFPKEIEKRRKQLYPVIKQAKQEKKRVKLVRDKLFINGRLYNPCIYSSKKYPQLNFANTRED